MTRPTARAPAGFSLVELMVSMTLSLILLAGALSILYSTKLTSSENERVARIQEAGRTAFELIKQDARAAGYTGCSRPFVDAATVPPVHSFTSGLNSTGLLWNFLEPVYGFEATTSTAWVPALDAAIPASPAPAGGSDILVLRSARPGQPVFRTNAAFAVDADIPVDRDAAAASLSTAQAAPIVVSDCRGATVILATGVAGNGPTAKISHAQSAAVPGNTSASLARPFAAGSQIQPVQTVIYYIASCAAGGAGACTGATTPLALWQIVGSNPPQELIQGVEAMQVKYGVDTDQDLLANQYVNADAVTDWNNVVSISIAILVRSIDETGVEKDKRTYTLLDTNIPAFNDRRQRSVFTTTISLRNATT